MKFTVSSKQQSYFRERGLLELEPIFTEEELEKWNREVDRATAKFKAKRDFWRLSGELKELVCSKPLAWLFAELIEARRIVLAYDRLIDEESAPSAAVSLKSMSCVQGVLGGVLLCLRAPERGESDSPLFLPPGGELFLSAETEFDFSRLAERGPFRYLLIVYAKPQACYILNPNDPMTHKFKEYGYVFGDRLLDHRHPILHRSS